MVFLGTLFRDGLAVAGYGPEGSEAEFTKCAYFWPSKFRLIVLGVRDFAPSELPAPNRDANEQVRLEEVV